MSANVAHVLDTSALLVYYLKENGWEVVHQLIFDATCQLSDLAGVPSPAFRFNKHPSPKSRGYGPLPCFAGEGHSSR